MGGACAKVEGARGVRWRGRYTFPDPATGKLTWRRLTARTKGECQQRIAEALVKAGAGAVIDERLTVAAYAPRWLAAIEPTVRPATYRRYHDLLTQRVLPALGGKRLARVTALDLQALYAALIETGLSPTTVRQVHAIIHRALKHATQWGILDRNVASLAQAPRRATPRPMTWSPDQVAAALAAGDRTDLAALWRIALLCGLRRGELLALRWEDVDLDRATLAVRRTLSRGAGNAWQLGEPKSAKSRRSVALPPSCVAAVRAHQDRQGFQRQRLGDGWIETGFLFTSRSGGPLHVNTLDAAFRRLIADAGVPRIPLHALRHTSATLLLIAGVSPKVVSERLGHASVGFTLDVYSHVTTGLQADAAARIDALARPAAPESRGAGDVGA